MNPKFFGKVKNGKLTLDDEGLFNGHLHTLEGDVEVVVKRRTNHKSIAKRFGISVSNVGAIVRKQSWSWL